jgi:hypothetical protein
MAIYQTLKELLYCTLGTRKKLLVKNTTYGYNKQLSFSLSWITVLHGTQKHFLKSTANFGAVNPFLYCHTVL